MTEDTVTLQSSGGPPARAPGWRVWADLALRRPRLLLVLLVLLGSLPGLLTMPPLDRDEARFAQATTQMVESGDYISIHFQGEPRNKKPAGIHWLQAASVWLFGDAEAHEIWAYRLPSLAGAILAVLVTFSLGQTLVGRRQGILAAALLGGCIIVAVEGFYAKTDAVLLFSVVSAQLALARCWMARDQVAKPELGTALAFWAAVGLGILVKGPINPLVIGFTVLALGFSARRWRWMAPLRPLIGVPVMLAIAAPWFVAITLRDSEFLIRAANEDLIPKLLRGVESHGAPPGTYLVAHLLAFWPAALFTIPALIAAWLSRRRVDALPFVLAWLIPSWLMFELVPTKLVHYTLPAYPALALMVAWAVFSGSAWLKGRLAKAFALLTFLGGLVLAVGVVYLPIAFDEPGAIGPAVVAAILVVAAAWGAGWFAWRAQPLRALVWGIPMTVLVAASGLGLYAPKLQFLWLSPRLVETYEQLKPADAPPLASAGYHEPSLVFLAGQETELLSAPAAADYLAKHPKALVAVTGREAESFLAAARAQGIDPVARGDLEGVNYSKARREVITLYGRDR